MVINSTSIDLKESVSRISMLILKEEKQAFASVPLTITIFHQHFQRDGHLDWIPPIWKMSRNLSHGFHHVLEWIVIYKWTEYSFPLLGHREANENFIIILKVNDKNHPFHMCLNLVPNFF